MPGESLGLLAQETIFYLRVDPVQPSLGMIGLVSERSDLGLKLLDPVFGSMKLMRQLLCPVSCLPSIALGNFRRPPDELHYRLAGLIELVVSAFRSSVRTSKWNYIGTFPALFVITHADTSVAKAAVTLNCRGI
jgi:hypothetical protein